MNLRFSTLEHESLSKLTAVFNAAFANYFIPIKMTEEAMAVKFRADNTRTDLSAGAYAGDELVGFIFHGYGQEDGFTDVYNGGTGVIPEYRGQHLPRLMYEFVLPHLKQNNVERSVLEVITGNEKAIKVYREQGFNTVRKVNCYKGTIHPLPQHDIEITETQYLDMNWLKEISSFTPTWQNKPDAIGRIRQDLVFLIAKENETPVGCIVMNPKTGKIFQLAVAPSARKKGVGRALLSEAASRNNNLVALNADERDMALNNLMLKAGFSCFLSQYEMEWILPQ
jgi:ribosomal protein S18 acetylase RimI-like enzyme